MYGSDFVKHNILRVVYVLSKEGIGIVIRLKAMGFSGNL